MIHIFERTTVLNGALDEVFGFFEDPRNLAKITPRWMGFEIIKVDDGPMREDFRIVYRIKWMGLGLRWVTRISEYDPPHRFVDVQLRGPYRSWRHEHSFEASGAGTIMRDTVRYSLPFGILGDVVHRLVVRRQVRRIFDYRARRITKLFAGGEPARAEAP